MKEAENNEKQVIVNYVWLGSNPLGPLEKFNLASWRAFGHSVNIYTYPFANDVPRTEVLLGIEPGDATIFNLSTILKNDSKITDTKDPKKVLDDARTILMRWLEAVPKQGLPTKEHIYNIVDLTKSYIGGTQRGIVLDTKVGPSPHLLDYIDSFNNKLISYTRGGNTAEIPENQCIGTMQEAEELRLLYAERFNEKVKGLADKSYDSAWFNTITGYHGQSYQATKKWLDVATKTPAGAPIGESFPVSEPGEIGHGPFRVFKRSSDQSNKNGVKTKPNEVSDLAKEVWKKELPKDTEHAKNFYKKAETAMKNLPRKDMW